jgi:hypothetical protein
MTSVQLGLHQVLKKLPVRGLCYARQIGGLEKNSNVHFLAFDLVHPAGLKLKFYLYFYLILLKKDPPEPIIL